MECLYLTSAPLIESYWLHRVDPGQATVSCLWKPWPVPFSPCLQVGPGGSQGLVYVAIAVLIDFQLDID